MILMQKKAEYDEGTYGRVFFIKSENKAIKVFKRTENKYKQVDNVFKSEVQAYKLIELSDTLKKITPNFYGTVKISSIFDENGMDISDNFYLDKAYQMEYVEGVFEKIGSFDGNIRTLIFSIFDEAGIKYVKDASIIFKDNEVKCVIDFAAEEYELFW